MTNQNNAYHKPTVNFDKTNWSVEFQESFFGVMGILDKLFKTSGRETKEYPKTGHKKIRTYTNGIDSLQIYYLPRDSFQPKARIVFKSENNLLSFFEVISEELPEDNFTVEISKNGTSINIDFGKDVDTTSPLETESSKTVKKGIKDYKITNDLLMRLDTILKGMGYEFQKDDSVKSKKPDYLYSTVFKNDWFRITVEHSPVNQSFLNQDFPFATFQIDSFKKEDKQDSYWILMFFLSILKAYKIPELEDSYQYPILPSEMEISCDFHGYEPEFLFELTRSINCRKRKSIWWSNKPKTKNPYTVEDDKNSLLSASHYVGDREDGDYQIAIYNKPKKVPTFTRLEFRLKDKNLRPHGSYDSKKRKNRRDKGLKDPSVDCVDDLFTKHWILDFLKKITFSRPNKKAFERIDSSYHPLADVSLKAFLSKIPTDKKANFTRCLKKNTELKKLLVAATNEFQYWLTDLYMTSSIMVISRYKVEDTFEVVYDGESNTPIRYPVVQDKDLKELFRRLPANTSVGIHKLENAIRFSILDNQHNVLADIIIGKSPERFIELGDIYYVEDFKDVFRESPNQINTKKI